ncbi:MAG: autotransporter domain-containing protein [Alphaproteobacteria bacterium]|nr:autotransporter domain-containing protein [Alphaproteobacteria bacterium]MBP3515463.1 autotransporter domain-containing protein [Alphaproteobacteria bacterium]
MKKTLYCLEMAVLFLCLMTFQAKAAYFSDFVYQNVKAGNVLIIKKFLDKGYNIDAVNPDGMTALCSSVYYKDYKVYSQLRAMGANPRKQCMERVDGMVQKAFEDKYTASPFYVNQPKEPVVAAAEGDDTLQYVAGGALALGLGTAAVLLLDDDGDSSDGHKNNPADPDIPGEKTCPEGEELVGDECRPIVCPEGSRLEGNVCVPIVCPEGSHLVGSECVPDCPEGEVWNGSACEAIVCPEGAVLVGNDCVCPTGQRLEGDKCVAIVCPENTHLVGNLCVADAIDKENPNPDEDFYGIKSDKEAVFNLYSSPKYPDDEASIVLKNTGDRNVYGMYGYGGEAEVFNSYVVGYNSNGDTNPIPSGTGNIKITNQGSGDVYGLYSQITDITQYKEAINASGWQNGISYGNIDITHMGGGTTYGVFGDVRAYNAFAVYGGEAYGNISITGDGNIYGISGYVAASNAVSHPFSGHKVEGNISLHGTGTGDIYGMMVNKDNIPGAGAGDKPLASWFAFNAYSSGGDEVAGTINIRQDGSGDVYGMYGGQQLYNAMAYGRDKDGNPTGTSVGKINIENFGNGQVYGMYLSEKDKEGIVANVNDNGSHSEINIVNTGSGTSTGMRGGQQTTVLNSGDININNLGSGTAIGIYGERDSTVHNSGNIHIYRDEYTDGENVLHTPDGVIGGTAYGIYAESGAHIYNGGTIVIEKAGAGKGVLLEDGAVLENTGTISFNGVLENASAGDEQGQSLYGDAVDFDKMGGEVLLGKGGRFFADKFVGNLGVSKDLVKGSFEDEYRLSGALQAKDIEELSLNSKSAMFKAKSVRNDNGGNDVVLERTGFNELIARSDLADFFENNYNDKKGQKIFDLLKNEETSKGLNKTALNLTGNDVLPLFEVEDRLVYHHLSRQFNDNLFNRPDENYIGGYKYIDISREADGTLLGNDGRVNAAYGMVKTKGDNGLVYGLGASIANLKSDYDNASKRKSNTFGLWAPVGYDFDNKTRWYSKFYAGYSDGSYDRRTPLATYSADMKGYQFGLSNEVRHKIELKNGLTFEPLAELNVLSLYQDGFSEGNKEGALNVKGKNRLSVEGGLGAYLAKEFEFDEDNKLRVQIGGIYYVEFADGDDGFEARLHGMNRKAKIVGRDDDGRAVFSAKINYTYKDITLYGMLEQETGDSKAFSLDAGIEYKF